MIDYAAESEKAMKDAQAEIEMRLNKTWIGSTSPQRASPWDILKRQVLPPSPVDKSPKHAFKKFHDRIEQTKDHDLAGFKLSHVHNLAKEEVYPHRYASFYVYEANNKTKQFKVAVFVNSTSQDVVAMWP